MATSSSPVRLDSEITSSARKTASAMSRSVAEQISHWARLGRELERSPEVSLARIQKVLEGKAQYDGLAAEEQAVVRTQWAERMKGLHAQLRLDREFLQKHYDYAELDDKGRVLIRPAAAGETRKRTVGTRKPSKRKSA
jgi:hypothetical protein